MDKCRELYKDHGELEDCSVRGTGDACEILDFRILGFGFCLVSIRGLGL